MTDKLLYVTIIPASVIIIVALLSAEFIGRGKHIGRFYTFFMMLGIIPGIIGLLFSPIAKSEPTKANFIYFLLAIFLFSSGLFSFYQIYLMVVTDNFNFVNIFVLISFYSAAIYCFELSQGGIKNNYPKFYFEKNDVNNNAERKSNEKLNILNIQIENLKELKEKGILTENQFNSKVLFVEQEKTDLFVKNTQEYIKLKSLVDNGVLTIDEFNEKIKLIKDQNEILKESIKKHLSIADLNIIKKNYIKENKTSCNQIRNKLENVLKIKTHLEDCQLIELVIDELEKK